MRLILVLLLFWGCAKRDCNTVTITNHTPGSCAGWGVVSGGITYPSRNIPDAFKQAGLTVCSEFEIYDDLSICPCCGGKYARIINMSLRPD